MKQKPKKSDCFIPIIERTFAFFDHDASRGLRLPTDFFCVDSLQAVIM